MIPPTLLTIPLEIRRSIYKELFSLTTVRHGFESTSSEHTSILRACRQIHNEAKEYILPNITLHFFSTARMLDCLTAMSPEDISQIRYIRVKGFPFPVYVNEFYFTTYDFASVLPLFPGLQLDLFTVEDCYHDPGDGWANDGTYGDINVLLKTSGWKELHYTTPTNEFLRTSRDGNIVQTAQPDVWNKVLQGRDGENSGAEVKMYVANEPNMAGMAENPDTRSEFSVTSGQNLETVKYQEVLIVGKRGKGASYIEDGSTLEELLRELFRTMTWQKVKESDKYVDPEDDPCSCL